MSENEQSPRNTQQDRATFDEMMEYLRRNQDAGIAEFEEKALEVSEALGVAYVEIPETDDGRDIVLYSGDDEVDEEKLEEELHEAAQDLGTEWMHGDHIATVTGRIYVSDTFGHASIPSDWGKKEIDEYGIEFYVVDNVKLRSEGIDVISLRTDEGALADIRVIYDFSFPDDFEQKPVVFAYANELFSHTYEIPSPQEAITRLSQDWPEELMLIDKALSPNGEDSLPVRLRKLVETLQDAFSESDIFTKSVERYIQHFANFGQVLPYMVGIKNEFQLFDGKNITIQEDDATMWPTYSVDRGLSIRGMLPLVKFVKQENGSVECYIQVLRYNDEKGDDDPEFVRINVDSIASFRSEMAKRSLLSQVKFNSTLFSQVDPEVFEDDEDGGGDEADIQIEIVSSSAEVGLPPFIIEGLEVFEAELREVITKAQQARKRVYHSHEEAETASREFIRNEMGELFRLYEKCAAYELIVSGAGVSRPGVVRSENFVSDEESEVYTISYTIDVKNPLKALEPWEKVFGMLDSYYIGIEEVPDDISDDHSYRINPGLTLDTRERRDPVVVVSGIEFMTHADSGKIQVPLDGSVDITIPTLETYRESIAQIAALAPGTIPESIIGLMQALQNEVAEAINEGTFVAFSHPELFSMVNDLSAEAHVETKDDLRGALMSFFETVLVKRTIRVDGDMLVKHPESGEYVPLTIAEDEGLIYGSVVDVRSDIDGSDAFLVLTHGLDDAIVAVRMRSIKQLLF